MRRMESLDGSRHAEGSQYIRFIRIIRRQKKNTSADK